MQNWQTYFDRTFVISLAKRQDRRTRMQEIFEEYDIEGEIFEATEKIDEGDKFLGLVDSTKRLFNKCLGAGFEQILVLEDDCEFVVKPDIFNETMEKCVDDLKGIHWGIFYLGLQHPRPFNGWRTRNLVHVNMGYSTHALAYSRHYMQFFVDFNVIQPIDNFNVEKYQHYNTCFASYPLLATQRTNFSDICMAECNWDIYIQRPYENAIRDILQLRP